MLNWGRICFRVHLGYHCCSVTKSCLTLCDPMNCSTLGFPVLQYLLEFTQVHVHWVGDAIQPSPPLPPSSPFIFSFSQHQQFWPSALHIRCQSIGALRLLEEFISSYPEVWESITTYQSVRAWTVPLFFEATHSSGHVKFPNVTAYLIKSAWSLLSKPVSKKSLSNIVWSQIEHTFTVPYIFG